MQIINNILSITVPELINCGVKEATIKVGLNRQRQGKVNCWNHSKIGNKVYIDYNSLKDNYKELIRAKLCNGNDPVEYFAFDIFTKNLSSNAVDVDFIRNYKVNDDFLPEMYINDYLKSCQVLYLLSNANKVVIKSFGFSSAPQFYEMVTKFIATEGLSLPKTYNRLKIKVRDYKKDGAKCIISKKFGNNNSKKIEEIHEATIVKLLQQHNQLPCEMVAEFYNHIAKEQSWCSVSSSTVKNIYTKHKIQIDSERKGSHEWKNNYEVVVNRKRPSQPNILWVGDGTPYELYYQEDPGYDKNGKKLPVKYWNRVVVYVVIDAYNDYICGFSVGKSESAGLAKAAWKNACVWQGVTPYQVQTDRFALDVKLKGDLASFYKSIALEPDFFTPAAVGNAKSKVVEQFFAKLYNKVTRLAPNASGRNITAKEQPNREKLYEIRKDFPFLPDVINQIADHVNYWNNLVMKKQGFSREQQRIDANRKHIDLILDDNRRLQLFGAKNKRLNTLTSKGLTFELNSVKRVYFLDDIEFLGTIGASYQIIYDENDFSKILAVSYDGRKKYMLSEDIAIPMAFMDMEEGDRKALNSKLEKRKELHQTYVKELPAARNKMLEEAGIDALVEAESYMKSMAVSNGSNKGLIYTAQDTMKNLDRAGALDDIYNDPDIFNDDELLK